MHTALFLTKSHHSLIRRVYASVIIGQATPRRLLSRMEGYVLECLQRLHDPIPLPDNTPVRLGRSEETQITDPRCSRLQVEVQVSWKTGEIKVTQLGANTSAVDGRDLVRGKTVSMPPDSTLFILSKQFPHRVVFKGKNKPPNNSAKDSPPSDGEPRMKPGMKRAASATNGVKEDNVPPKKQRRSKDCERDEGPESSSKEGSVHKKGSKNDIKDDRSSCKTSANEVKASARKVTDFFAPSKSPSKKTDNGSEKEGKHHTTEKKDKDSPTDTRDRDGHRRRDRHKADAETDRKNSSDGKNRNSKRTAKLQELSDEDDDAHMKSVSDKLQKLKQKAKAEKIEKSSTASDEKRKSSTDSAVSDGKRKSSTDSSTKCKLGKPAPASVWDSMDEKLYIYTAEGLTASEKIAGFDIDGTIITTQSGRVFPKDMTDWKILMPEVFGKLKHLVAAGYKIVFFTNQLGVGRGKVKIDDLKDKFEKVLHKLQVPVQIFISTTGGSYRKPALGMWQILKKQKNDGISINMADSFFVGDAAGRQENWAPKKKKDFSCSDRLFAINAGLRFHTPEEFFLGHKAAPFNLPDFDPRAVSTNTPLLEGGHTVHSDSQEVVVFVGLQASGKSSFARAHLVPKGYIHVNQDSLKTWQKCVSECSRALAAGKNVVIDNTNVDPETRARYIDCAKKAGVPCRCFFFDFSISQCRHNERFREITNKDHKPINEQIFNSTKSRFKPPEAREGFSKIVRVNFVPNFPDKLHEKIYRQFLLEK